MDKTENLQTQAYNLILSKIMRYEYVPGQKISQKAIEGDLNMGRTPVREALLRLKHVNLVDMQPQSGTFVTKIDYELVKNALFIRENIESKIVTDVARQQTISHIAAAEHALEHQRIAAKSEDFQTFFEADDIFHQSFYIESGYGQIWDWLQTINPHLNRLRWLRLKVAKLPLDKFVEQHQAIYNAVIANDAETANQLAISHIHLMLGEQEIFKTFRNYFDNLPI
ncbi:MAG: GntR family transcriptional regulator [Streptococcaceae bacterium]|jgi:DNA-binding GntR family transcriptional regulator|nr:GntR family transcriptional regulator [Streptococcaceae bacterium]